MNEPRRENADPLHSWQTILSDVERRFDDYLAAEASTYGFKIKDERIHAALYFIEPSGHSLSAIDIEVMKRLHRRVNLIPVVAKSDTLSDEELTGFKQRVTNARRSTAC